MKIENGVHDIPNDIYHSSEGLSRSALMEFRRSPYHYWHKYINPERKPSYCSPQMKLGELVHALVLEPEYFSERYMLPIELEEMPPAVLLKDVGKEQFEQIKLARKEVQDRNAKAKEEFKLISEDKEIITMPMYREAKHYADAVMRDSVAESLFKDVEIEKSIYFTHEETGLQCKVRPDAWTGSIATDLKTCKDASYDAFQRAAYTGGYFIQAGMIRYALRTIGIELEQFIFFCVEKTEAAPCVYYPVDADDLERGERDFNALMHGIAPCFHSNRWDSYDSQSLKYPNWARD